MRKILFLIPLLIGTGALAFPAEDFPMDVDGAPQIHIGGRGIATLEGGKTADHENGRARMNFSDSSLRIGAAESLFDTYDVGTFEMGWQALEESAAKAGSQTYLDRAEVGYQAQTFDVRLGRGENPFAHMVDFPTLRGDDLVTLLNPTNPFSDGVNPEEHLTADAATFRLNQNLRFEESVFVQQLPNSAGFAAGEGINAVGAAFRTFADIGFERFAAVPYWGISYQRILLDKPSSQGLNQVTAGAAFNLGSSVVNSFNFSVQGMSSSGSDIDVLATLGDSFEADSSSVAASLQYERRPFGGKAASLALTGAYKNYTRISSENSWGAALTGSRQLGRGFHLVAQYAAQSRTSGLAIAQSHGVELEQKIEAGLEFAFEAVFNEHLSPRRSLLNQKHGFLSK